MLPRPPVILAMFYLMADAEVIIVGGGIGGLAVAIGLRQRGIESLVLEQTPELGEIGAGILLAPNACKVIARLEALPQLLEHSIAVPRWELRDWRGAVLSALDVPRAGESSLSTRRSDLQAALLPQLPAGALQLGCHVKSVALISEGVRLDLTDGRQLSAKKVIIADGINSLSRSSLWKDREPRYCGYVGWRALVDHVPAGWESGRLSESWGHGRRFGIAPVGDGRTYWYATSNVPEARCRKRIGIEKLRRDFSGWHEPVGELLAATSESALLQHPIADRRPPWHWQIDEKVVLLGDAAHPLTPNLGQGASMALEDAWELAAFWNRPHAMTRYEQSRRLRVMRLWAMSNALGKMIQWRHPALSLLRELQMRAVPNAVATLMMRRMLNYDPEKKEVAS